MTNPATFGPIYYAAWRVGAALLGEEGPAPGEELPEVEPAESAVPDAGWFSRAMRQVAAVGKPLLLGLSIFAVGMGLLSYFLASWIWSLRVRRRRKRRLAARGGT